MKTINLAATCSVFPLFGDGLAFAQPTGKSANADAAWKQLQRRYGLLIKMEICAKQTLVPIFKARLKNSWLND